ncbi:MAG TPA: hypothetical protein VKZ68_11510 [Ohtaekwangia sp.]|nr:hypothetical protein [Ohtaekwangia sp.]
MDRSIRGSLADRVRALLVLFLIFMFIVSLFSCEPTKETTQTIQKERQDIETEKRRLKEGLTFILRNVDNNLKKLDQLAAESNELSIRREALLKNRSELIEILKNVKSATNENWSVVSATATETLENFNFLSAGSSIN